MRMVPAPDTSRWAYPTADLEPLPDARDLVPASLLGRIGARRKRGEYGPGRAVWTIERPTFATSDGRYFLVVQPGGRGVGLCLMHEGREGRPAQMLDVGHGDLKAWVRDVKPSAVERWVLAFCTLPQDELLPIVLGWREP